MCIFTCCLLCLAFLLSNSNIVVRKNILFAFRQRPFTQYCKIEICAHERCAFLRAVCFAWLLLSNSNIVVRKIYFLPFGSGLLLNITRLRFVHMKGVHFYVLSALLGIFTE